jgi:hypothetical protein
MRKVTFSVVLVILMLSCKEEITVFVEKEPGSISGQILPRGVGAIVGIYQGPLFQEVSPDAEGYFKFSNVAAGTYTLRAKAPHYGTTEHASIRVEDGEGYDIGILHLYKYPLPLNYTDPINGATGVPIGYTNRVLYLHFNEPMNLESLRNAFSITPSVANMLLDLDLPASRYSKLTRYYVSGDFQAGTFYSFTIDSSAETETGFPLEFSYTSTFETEFFRVQNISTPYHLYGNYPITFVFNRDVNSTILSQYITTEPSIELSIPGTTNDYITIYPALSWMPDTIISFSLDRNLHDVDGNTLKDDTTIYFQTEPLKILDTTPHHNQYFVPLHSSIRVSMNNLIDEGTILSAIQIQPTVTFGLSTSVYSGRCNFYLMPDSLISNTRYTVTIDTSLRDYYGKNFSENYTFSFVTY